MEWLHDVVCYSVSCNVIPFTVEWSLPLLCWLVSLIFVIGSLMYCMCVVHWRSGEEGGGEGREERGGEGGEEREGREGRRGEGKGAELICLAKFSINTTFLVPSSGGAKVT